jgi:hypothetical protein
MRDSNRTRKYRRTVAGAAVEQRQEKAAPKRIRVFRAGCAESAEDQGIQSRIEGIKWARVRSHVRFSKKHKKFFSQGEKRSLRRMAVDEKQGATWAANAINSFHGWALISKDETGPLDID